MGKWDISISLLEGTINKIQIKTTIFKFEPPMMPQNNSYLTEALEESSWEGLDGVTS
jgi:hypothetical protein